MDDTVPKPANLLLAVQKLGPELSVVNDARVLFLLSYIHNNNAPLTYRDLCRELGWELRPLISECLELRDVGLLRLTFLPSEYTSLVELTDRCSSLLDRIGFGERIVLSVPRPLMRDEEVSQPAIQIPRPSYETVKVPLVEIKTEYSGDIVVMGVVFHPEGTTNEMDLANPVKELKGSPVRKVVVDFEQATELGVAARDILDLLREVYFHLKKLHGRFVLSSISPSIDRLVRQDALLRTLSIYGTEDSAIQALRDPPSKRSLGAGAM